MNKYEMMPDIKENRQFWNMMMKTGPQTSGSAISSYISSTYHVGAAMVRERWRFDRWANPCLRLAPDTVYCCRFFFIFYHAVCHSASIHVCGNVCPSFLFLVCDRCLKATHYRHSIAANILNHEAFCDFRCETVKKMGKNVIK